VGELQAVATDADYEHFVDRYGVRRTDAPFWAISDWLREDDQRANVTEGGLHGLDRYVNP